MNNLIKTTIIVIILAVSGVVIWNLQQKPQVEDTQSSSQDSVNDSILDSGNTEEVPAQSDQYKQYSADAVTNTEGNIVLFFYAAWCPTCNHADKTIKESLDQFPEDLTILIVDYDNSTDLKRQYGISYQHTFVQVDNNGNEITKWYGSYSIDEIEGKLL